MASDQQSVRLKNTAHPTLYALDLKVSLSTWSYTAKEQIALSAPSNGSDVLRLHCGKTIVPTNVTGGKIVGREMGPAQTIDFVVDKDLAEFTVEFSNVMQEDLRGLYRSTYVKAGEEKRVAATHFEPTDARRCYICLDEPAARATFRLCVRVPQEDAHLSVLSNAPEIANEGSIIDGWIVHRFQDALRVPPYLTVIIVGEFEYVATVTRGIPMRFFAVPGKVHLAQFGLEVASFALQYFEDFFKSKFPLPKLDLVAVPDFAIGGMENWGCITLIETALVDEKTASLASLKGTAELVCHEVSHNWFGNLVGIDWWEGLWLKEGFASWCGYHGTTKFRPQWCVEEGMVNEIVQALETDGHLASHPIEVPIVDPSDITQVFDAISYSKGMGVLRMLEAYLGCEKFSFGLAHYVEKYAYGNTITEQLWAAIEEATSKPVRDIMNSFTAQQGFPVVSVSFDQSKQTLTATR